MKYLILTLFISVLAIAAPKKPAQKEQSKDLSSVEPSEKWKKFVNESGIQFGEYELVSGPAENCLDGNINVVETDDGELAVIMGARALVNGLGKDKLSEANDECSITVKSKHKGKSISEFREEVCKDKKTYTTNTEVTLSGNKITYTKKYYENSVMKTQFKCALKLVK